MTNYPSPQFQDIKAATAEISGAASVGGALTAGSAAVAGAVSADSAAVVGEVTAGSAAVVGEVTAGSAAVVGALTAGSLSVNGVSIPQTFVYDSSNRIINGDMSIDQRWNGAAQTSVNAYTVDRWFFAASQTGKMSWGRNFNQVFSSIITPPQFPYYLGVQPIGGYTPVASDIFCLQQPIEGANIEDFAWGTSGDEPAILSFYAYSSVVGTFSGAIYNYSSSRSYPFSFSVPTINTWTKITITIPGDTNTIWQSNGMQALAVSFDLGCGTTYRGAANTWASASYRGVTGAVSIIETANAYYFITGVKLEVGIMATPFNQVKQAQKLLDCQRYYATGRITYGGYIGASEAVYQPVSLPATMRVSPTMTITDGGGTSNMTGLTTNVLTPRDFYIRGTSSSAGAFVLDQVYTANAEM
jgi:hypothetical protein